MCIARLYELHCIYIYIDSETPFVESQNIFLVEKFSKINLSIIGYDLCSHFKTPRDRDRLVWLVRD